MHDFGTDVNLKGKTVLIRNPPGTKKKFSVKERTFVITGGSGCNADPAYSWEVAEWYPRYPRLIRH